MKKKYSLEKEFANKWLNALESEEYLQGQSHLAQIVNIDDKKIYEYCCIGVAGLVCGIRRSRMLQVGVFGKGPDKYNSKKIPSELFGGPTENKLVQKLVELNDDEGYSFKQIAEWIRNNVKFV